MRDNEGMCIARAFAQAAQLDEAIREIVPALGPDVVSLDYSLGYDWSGDEAIFFKIVLSERASQRDQLHKAASKIQETIQHRLEPLYQWGVLDYFSYRSPAEQAARKDQAWV
jgi:hypothetical protein